MKYLLDTHIFYWSIAARSRLSTTDRSLVEDEQNDLYVSVASAWEMAIKVGSGKWIGARTVLESFEEHADRAGIELLTVTVAQARQAGLFQTPHKDPFDRLLAAQALDLDLAVVTIDPAFHQFGCKLV